MKLGWRPMAWGVVVAGVLLGRQGDAPRPAPLRHGDAVVLAVDFHVHSFPGDGSVAPWDLAVEARRRGLDAIALTNHNHRLQWVVTQALAFHPDGALLIPGEELTSVGYHMAVAGTERNVAWRHRRRTPQRAFTTRGALRSPLIQREKGRPDSTIARSTSWTAWRRHTR